MPDINTRADSIRLYLTGAASDGAAQASPDLSLGGYRSSSMETFFSHIITNPISNLSIDFISGAHAEGSGTITVVDADSLTWTPPEGLPGAAVSIASGESKILEAASAPGQFVIVSRTSAEDFAGAATVTLSQKYNNVIGFDNVSSEEAVAGDTEYRALMIRNESASEVKNVKVYLKPLAASQVSGSAQLAATGAGSVGVSVGSFVEWPNSGYCRVEDSAGNLKELVYFSSRTTTTLGVPANGRGILGTSAQAGAATDIITPVPGLRLAIFAPTAEAIVSIANESTQPAGAVWATPATKDNGLVIGDMAAGAMYGVFMERPVIPGAISEATVIQSLAWSFDAT
jgi:hypothetical protein